jgi:hypothetical protein
MGSARHDVPVFRRLAGGWAGLLLVVLACGGEREAVPPAGEGGMASADTAAPAAPAPDTASAAAPTDTAAAAADTAARSGPASRDTAAPAAKPAAPAPKPKPAPKPAERETTTAPADTAPTQAAAQPPTPPAPQPAAPQPAQDTPQTTAQEGNPPPLRDEYHQAPRDTVDQATYDGWKQYNLNCARCHGEDVLGSTIAPHLVMSLKPDGPIPTQESFMQVVCAGRPEKGMPAWCALGMDPQTINQIYSYVKGRSEGKIGPGRPARREG